MTARPDFRLHHGSISVSDLQRSIAFYGRVLGFVEDSRVSVPEIETDIVFLRRGSDYLEIFCHRNPAPLPDHARDTVADARVIGTKHIAFATDQPDELHAHLKELEVEGLTEIFDNNPTYRYFFFRDPDGIALEVVSPRSPQPRRRLPMETD